MATTVIRSLEVAVLATSHYDGKYLHLKAAGGEFAWFDAETGERTKHGHKDPRIALYCWGEIDDPDTTDEGDVIVYLMDEADEGPITKEVIRRTAEEHYADEGEVRLMAEDLGLLKK